MIAAAARAGIGRVVKLSVFRADETVSAADRPPAPARGARPAGLRTPAHRAAAGVLHAEPVRDGAERRDRHRRSGRAGGDDRRPRHRRGRRGRADHRAGLRPDLHPHRTRGGVVRPGGRGDRPSRPAEPSATFASPARSCPSGCALSGPSRGSPTTWARCRACSPTGYEDVVTADLGSLIGEAATTLDRFVGDFAARFAPDPAVAG